MSCIFAAKDTIDLIVSGAIEVGLVTYLPPSNDLVKITEEQGDAFGRMLWAENCRAFVHRYGDRAGDLRGIVDSYTLRRFLFVQYEGLFSLARFLDYQCSESADYSATPAALALRNIMGTIAAEISIEILAAKATAFPWGAFRASETAAFLRKPA